MIAVDISSKASGIASPTSMLGNVNQSITIMGQKLGALELQRADIVIRPQVGDIGATDFEQKNRAILEGERAAQAALLPDRRRAMEMFHVDGLPYREIAAKLGVPMGTVCTWISRGRRSIADALGDEGKLA